MHGVFYRATDDLCIDDANDSDTNYNKVQVWDCEGDAAQQWVAQSGGTIMHDTDCLDVHDGGTTSGTLIDLYGCDGSGSQQWIPLGDRELYNPQSGLCINDTSETQGTQLTLGACTDANAEAWDLPYSNPTGTGEITSQIKAGECLDNYLGGTTGANKVDIWTCNGGTDSQEWTVAADGSIEVAGGCLATVADGTANGALVAWYTCTGDSNQHWFYESNGSLVNMRSGTCLDDPSAVTTDGTQEQIWTCLDDIQQSWNLP
jgi:hypothetical protein